MNEQLVVKNFGPIKDATVDFKRVTVFIGPTGGGKSTLAKLAAVFQSIRLIGTPTQDSARLTTYGLTNFQQLDSRLSWKFGEFSIDSEGKSYKLNDKLHERINLSIKKNYAALAAKITIPDLETLLQLADEKSNVGAGLEGALNKSLSNVADQIINISIAEAMPSSVINYFPSERAFVSTLEYSWAGLMRDDIGLAKSLLDFANKFSVSRKTVEELEIDFLNVKYLHIGGRDFIKVPEREEPLMLLETASGIQSVTPMLVLLEHLSRNNEQAQSFIIEEPELNLYPTAQQGLLNWLVEKCTKGENDLTITTHSPYLLAHLNVLLFAHQVAENHPERAEEVAEIVPRESWIDPKEFAAYHVEGQQENGVRSIVNPETGLISYNGLDALATAEAAQFEKLLDINAGLEVE